MTVARGDGVGPEIMDSVLSILQAANANIAPHFISIGEQVYNRGVSSGIDAAGWESLNQTKVMLKAPITSWAAAICSGRLSKKCETSCRTPRR